MHLEEEEEEDLDASMDFGPITTGAQEPGAGTGVGKFGKKVRDRTKQEDY